MTLRYKLRTLLILLAILPPLLWIGWTKYEAWKAERERQRAREAKLNAIDRYVLQRLSVLRLQTGAGWNPSEPVPASDGQPLSITPTEPPR